VLAAVDRDDGLAAIITDPYDFAYERELSGSALLGRVTKRMGGA
jgi:hypothetical protein